MLVGYARVSATRGWISPHRWESASSHSYQIWQRTNGSGFLQTGGEPRPKGEVARIQSLLRTSSARLCVDGAGRLARRSSSLPCRTFDDTSAHWNEHPRRLAIAQLRAVLSVEDEGWDFCCEDFRSSLSLRAA